MFSEQLTGRVEWLLGSIVWEEGASGGKKDRNLRSNYPLKELEWPLEFCICVFLAWLHVYDFKPLNTKGT